MAVKFANNAATTLASSISSGATSFSVASASGFPTLGGSDHMYVTIDTEVVKVTAVSGTTFTCDATSSGHSSGDTVEIRVSAELLNDFATDQEALPVSGGQMSGNITFSGSQTVDGRDLSADGTKLDGIEASATADQTNAEIRAAVEAASDSNVFTDADHSKLNAIEASADVTDATNVTAAGALMDSEVTNLAQVKAFDSSDYATAAQGTLATNALPKAGGTMTGDLILGDNVKLEVGSASGGDLQIYHDGGDSYITDAGTGALYIASNEIKLTNAGASENVLVGVEDGTVRLYHNNVSKAETTANGLQVNGTAVATTDTDTSNTGSVTLDFGANQNFVLTLTGNVTLANPSTEQVGQSGFITFIQDGTGSRTVSLGTDYETAGGAGLTLTSTASATDIVPYVVVASGRILLGAPQLAFA